MKSKQVIMRSFVVMCVSVASALGTQIRSARMVVQLHGMFARSHSNHGRYNTMRLKEICLIAIATAMLCIFAQPALATSAMSVEPAYIDVWQGDEFTVNITVDPEENGVYCGSYTLHFNNTILNVTSQTRGPLLRQDGQSSTEWWNEIDNTTGKVEYSECRVGDVGGVTGSGVLATITFQVIGDKGTSALDISDYNGELLYSTTGSIPTDIHNGHVGIAQTQFVISGYVSYADGSDCNYPTVNITNLNIGEEWTAETSGNYYQLTLESCADIIAGEILWFDAISPDGSQSSVTEHTVTQAEVGAGGFEYNITLEFRPPGDVDGDGEITSADATIALRMGVCGEYDPAADVNHDDSVTSLDSLMIMQAANDIL